MKIIKKTSIITAIVLAVFLIVLILVPSQTAYLVGDNTLQKAYAVGENTIQKTYAVGDNTLLTSYATGENTVFLGGSPIGIIAKTDGLIVSELVNVTTKSGSFSPALQAGILRGDIIKAVDGVAIDDMITLNEIIANSKNPIVFSIKRGDESMQITITPVFDLVQNALKIGLMVKNDLAGIGTLTFITKDYKFGALGHLITDAYGYGDIYQNGRIYSCEINGFIMGKEGQAGELQGNLNLRQGPIGIMNKNIFCGIFGNYDSKKLPDLIQIPVANRNDVKQGKAYIYTTIDKNAPEMYEIEIVKVQKQDKGAEKGMVIRVVDSTLKVKTGGILQGMSGSPIIQNGKLIGAVTHVFISDPTKGYGIFIDWMLQN